MICPWCKTKLSNMCIKTENGLMHTWCKIAEDNPEKTDEELWDLIDPPGNPMPLPRGKPWKAPRERVEKSLNPGIK